MADNYWLTTPAGTVINIGSWLRADPGPDFDPGAVRQYDITENAWAEGGAFAFERHRARRFRFPLTLASGGAGLDLHTLEGLLQRGAAPGAVIDLKPDGVATADMVRFDVIDGRLDADYDVWHQRVSRRLAALELTVEPFGYSPTWILLASVASVALPASIGLTGVASLYGDAPGFVDISIYPITPTTSGLGTYVADAVFWSMGARNPSFLAGIDVINLGSYSGVLATVINDELSPIAQRAVQAYVSPTQAGWTAIQHFPIASAVEPAYRGRHRVWAWAKLTPSQGVPWRIAADVAPAALTGKALASGNPVATLVPAARGGSTPVMGVSPGYHIVDLGEHQFPPAGGSGIQQDLRLRIWAAPGTANVGVPTPIVQIGALFLQALDGPAGVLARGLAQPSYANRGSVHRLHLQSHDRRALVGQPSFGLASVVPVADVWQHHYGQLPMIGPTVTRLDLMTGYRNNDLSIRYADTVIADAPLAYFRLDDASGNATMREWSGNLGRHGMYTMGPSLAQPGALLGPSNLAAALLPSQGYAIASGINLIATSWTVEMWAQRATVGLDMFAFAQGSAVGYGLIAGGYHNGNYLRLSFVGEDVTSVPSWPAQDVAYSHLAFTFNAASRVANIYRDGSMVASKLVATTLQASGLWNIGRHVPDVAAAGTFAWRGLIDEYAIYPYALSASQVAAHHGAGASAPSPVPSFPLAHVSAQGIAAAAAVRYRPRFTFMKAL